MVEFLFVIMFLGLLAFFIYLPAIIAYFKWKHSEKEFRYQLKLLDESDFFLKCMVCETKPLGVGSIEPNGDISFEQAMKNQDFALNSIMSLMDDEPTA